MPHEKISIVTPSFNQVKFLGQTIESVLSQDYPDVEYLVIDGGSIDGSKQLLQRYQSKLAYCCSERDGGQADAIFKGFERSSGTIMGWINSDDLLLPGALKAVADFFKNNPEVEVVSGGAYCIDSDGVPLGRGFGAYTLGVAATHGRLRYYHLDGVFQPATFWRRSAYDAVGGLDRSLKFILDRDLFVRLAERKRFARLSKMLACFRIHDDSKSVNIQHVREIESEAFRERYGANRYGSLARRLLFYRYRVPSLMRKLWLRILLESRHVKLDQVC